METVRESFLKPPEQILISALLGTGKGMGYTFLQLDGTPTACLKGTIQQGRLQERQHQCLS